MIPLVKCAWTACLLALFAAPAPAGGLLLGEPAQGASERVTIAVEPSDVEIAAGSAGTVQLAFECPDEHYVWHDSIKLSLAGGPADASVGAFSLPEPKSKYDEFAEATVEYLDGEFAAALEVRVGPQVEPGDYEAALEVRYTECSPDLCRLGSERLPLALTVLPAGEGAAAPQPPEPARHRLPVVEEGAGPPEQGTGPFAGKAPLLAILVAYVFGLGLVFTPCVYPLIPVTVSLVGATSGESRLGGLVRSLVYVFGISVTYSAVGTIAAATGGMFGAWAQHPAVFIALAVIFVALALAMFDVYVLDFTSQRVERLRARLRGRAGLVGIWVVGLLSGAAATACIAPVILGALTYVAQRGTLLLGFLIFFAMAWGMGTPLVVLGTFTGLAGSLPKSGQWMVAVKRVFGLALLGVAVYFVGKSRLLPGLWFGMFVAAFLLGAGVFVGAFDLVPGSAGWWQRLRKAAGLILVGAALAAFLSALGLAGRAPVPAGAEAPAAIRWLESEPAALAAAREEGRPVLLDFWAEWCAPCKRMFETTYVDPDVVREAGRFVGAKIDVDRLAPPERERLLEEYRVRGVPTVVLIAPDGERTTRAGYIGPDEMLRLLRGVE